MTAPEPLNYLTPGAVPPRKRISRGMLGWILFLALAAILYVWLKAGNPGPPIIALSDFYEQLNMGNVATVYIGGDELEGVMRRPVTIGSVSVFQFRAYLPQGTSADWAFTQFLLKASPGTSIRAEASNSVLNNFILPFIPWLLIFFFIWFFVFRQLRKNNAARQPMPVVVVKPEETR